MARVLVLDGHSSAALAFTRSLGRAGYWVAVGFNRGEFAPAALSRYCQQSIQYPVPTADPLSFIEFVADFVRLNAIELVLPMTDWTTFPLVRERARIRGFARLAAPNLDVLETVSDKYATIALARELNIPVPETLLAHSVNDLEAAKRWTFPAVVKDRSSVRWLGDKTVFGSASYAYSWNDLVAMVQQRLERAGDVLVQEFVHGVGVGFSSFAVGGTACLPFQWERVREGDPCGGASTARKSVPLDAQVFEFGRDLMIRSGFQGIAMVEFKRDPATGRLCLMEINGRPWGSLQLAVEAGIDYPRHVVEWHLHGTKPPVRARYKTNITCRRVVGDLNHLARVRKGRPPGWPGAYPGFWSTLVKISVPWYPGLRYEDLYVRDLRPGLAELFQWFRLRLGRRITPAANSNARTSVRGIVHSHTTLSYDGEVSLNGLCRLLRQRGFRFVALTEHPLGLSARDFEEFVRKCREASDSDFVAIPGIEFRCGEGVEIAGIGISRWLEPGTPDELVARIREAGGFAVWVHPWRKGRWSGPFVECDAVEVMNLKLDGTLAPNLSLLRLTRKERKAGKRFYAIFGVDFHARTQPLSAWVECQVSELTPAAIVESLREGRFVSRVPYAAMSSSGRAGLIGYPLMVLFRFAALVWSGILHSVPASVRTSLVNLTRPIVRALRAEKEVRKDSGEVKR